jgi:hypothetical protein
MLTVALTARSVSEGDAGFSLSTSFQLVNVDEEEWNELVGDGTVEGPVLGFDGA